MDNTHDQNCQTSVAGKVSVGECLPLHLPTLYPASHRPRQWSGGSAGSLVLRGSSSVWRGGCGEELVKYEGDCLGGGLRGGARGHKY